MDRRVVASGPPTQKSAVPIFRQEGRVALPVTDSAGALIGIVTVDDVLDVAESTATRTLHRFGDLEALDELYSRRASRPWCVGGQLAGHPFPRGR